VSPTPAFRNDTERKLAFSEVFPTVGPLEEREYDEWTKNKKRLKISAQRWIFGHLRLLMDKLLTLNNNLKDVGVEGILEEDTSLYWTLTLFAEHNRAKKSKGESGLCRVKMNEDFVESLLKYVNLQPSRRMKNSAFTSTRSSPNTEPPLARY
jgi:hypothetical protein